MGFIGGVPVTGWVGSGIPGEKGEYVLYIWDRRGFWRCGFLEAGLGQAEVLLIQVDADKVPAESQGDGTRRC